MRNEDGLIRLLGGSTWQLQSPSLALVTDDIVIVLLTDTNGIAFLNKEEIPVAHRGGAFHAQTGYFGQVVRAARDGSTLQLNDGSMWSVPHYDQYDTGWWLPPYKVIVTASGLDMINLKENKKVWVKQVR